MPDIAELVALNIEDAADTQDEDDDCPASLRVTWAQPVSGVADLRKNMLTLIPKSLNDFLNEMFWDM